MLVLLCGFACTPNQRIIESSRTPVPPAATTSTPSEATFDSDLQAMRDADFKFVLAFRRKDGGVMDADDKAFVNANTPYDVNRRKLSDGGKVVLIGTNFPLLPGNVDALTSRFLMQDHSRPDAGPLEMDRNANAAPNRKTK